MQRLKTFIVAAKYGSPKVKWVLFGLLVVVALFSLQGASINDQFLSDDYDWVRNARLRVTGGDWLNAFENPTGGNFYRPLVAFGFQIDYALWGYDVFGYHLHQILVHVGLIMAFAWLLVLMTGNRIVGFSTALLLAVYPSHHEVVTWIAGRPDLYAAAFGVTSLALFASFLKQRTWWTFTLCCITAAAAFLSKEISFVLPALMVAVVFMVIPVREWKKLLVACAWALPVITILLIVLYVRGTILSDAIGGYLVAGERKSLDFQALNFGRLFTSAAYLINWDYVQTIFGNNEFFLFAKRSFDALLFHWKLALSLLSMTLVAMLMNRRARPRAYLAFFGLWWAIVSFVPIFGLDAFIAPNLTATRLFFSSSIGCAIILAALIVPMNIDDRFRRWRGVTYGIVLVAFTALWIFNYLPWNHASNKVFAIKQQFSLQSNDLLAKQTTSIFIRHLPGLYHGAYLFFGEHSVRESVYEVTRNDAIEAYLVGGRPYANSPLCNTKRTGSIAYINWDEEGQVFTKGSQPVEQMLNDRARSPAQDVTWDFSDPATVAQWSFTNIAHDQTISGLMMDIPPSDSRFMLSPKLAELFLGDYRSIQMTFDILKHPSQFGHHRSTVSWAYRDTFHAINELTYEFNKTTSGSITIPTCQHLNWSLTDIVTQLRILPIQSGTILLKKITLTNTI